MNPMANTQVEITGETIQMRSRIYPSWLPKKTLQITDTKDSDVHFYLINRTGRPSANGENTTPRGVVAFEIRAEDTDSPVAVVIPNTWAPIDLATLHGVAAIRKSTSLRRLISKNLLAIVSHEDVERELIKTDSNYFAEVSRALASNEHETNPLPIFGVASQSKEADKTLTMVMSICEMVSSGNLTEEVAVSMLKPSEASLSQDAILYLVNVQLTKLAEYGTEIMNGRNK